MCSCDIFFSLADAVYRWGRLSGPIYPAALTATHLNFALKMLRENHSTRLAP